MDVNQKKKNRYLFLESLYKESNGNTNTMFSMWEVGTKLNFDQDETQRIVDYLIGEDLIEARGLGGIIGLTHWGIKEVEQALENPSEPTEHFLPINIINIGTMTNSALQQGTTNSTLSLHFEEAKLQQLDIILESLKNVQDILNLSVDIHQELVSEIQTLQSQRKSPRPKNNIISESLKTVRSILESVMGNAITPIIIGQITQILK